ncbi:MAG: (d)CMP kinase [Betaproteobacteria bacterium]|nr:(d)CMP kinase [Gammaproteobacteria bacterium]MDH3437870.1 (d)CMP kinase [Betaproteobacteria bacterium]
MASEQTIPVIAIDGPSGSGKGTVAHAVAGILGFHYLNSGALYRTVALAALESGADLENALVLRDIALNLMVKFDGESVLLGGRDVTNVVRSEAVSLAASRIAGLPEVRDALLERQHALRQPPGLVADGRDMGSVVFPDALLKIFLTASAEERAKRRYKQLMDKGLHATMTTLLQDIRERDWRDSARTAAPLRQSADAALLDTTQMSVEEVVAQVLALYKQARRTP